ncbi:peptide-methionine (S)-S-oxide reductase MsrA [Synechococcus sp. CS-1328]|uniref:peptide-methionine (S)-S-oxide reductase MsrA n=1 Tax=Synechococcus sp. CS-1328 TaxID=2847976 RepID=UPI00223BD3FB|nr:peptide-methionine (S)-S-oxide reductase MsrA [Synechococcus sp. CS-1328]MCT0224130.1 peptide-methionine (S)-S-oxide reductase MsrA [Synechococcus sp. CS-1328]
MRPFAPILIAVLGVLAIPALLAASPTTRPSSPAAAEPASAIAAHLAPGSRTAVLAGGCFWGMEAVFEQVKGVSEVVSGYAGGSRASADYPQVSAGRTGHAEAVKITYDPKLVSYDQLLAIYFSVAHDPTQLNRQGPDIGTQYRSAIFFTDPSQELSAKASITELTDKTVSRRPIVTQVVPLQAFYPAEAYHQDYILHNPGNPYVMVHDLPKLAQLRQQYSQLLK